MLILLAAAVGLFALLVSSPYLIGMFETEGNASSVVQFGAAAGYVFLLFLVVPAILFAVGYLLFARGTDSMPPRSGVFIRRYGKANVRFVEQADRTPQKYDD